MAKAIVIGSGFGGLGAAIRLAAKGHTVEVFEKRDKPGGRAYVYEMNGFKFDGGPTVITAPFMLEDIWQAAGKNWQDYFQMTPCDPYYRIFDINKGVFNYNGDEEFILGQIEKWNPTDRDGYTRFMATTKANLQKGFVELADKPFLNFTDMLKVAPDFRISLACQLDPSRSTENSEIPKCESSSAPRRFETPENVRLLCTSSGTSSSSMAAR